MAANAQNNISGTSVQASVPGKPVISMPATNLNIGMDLWSASPGGSGATKLRPNPSGISSSVAPAAMVGREGVMPDQWIQVRNLAVVFIIIIFLSSFFSFLFFFCYLSFLIFYFLFSPDRTCTRV